MNRFALLLLAASLTGCYVDADGHDEPHYDYVVPEPPPPPPPTVNYLDCRWLEEWNCWKQAAVEAAACTPQRSAGLFADWGQSCYYADGTAVFFERAVSEPLPADYYWSFLVEDPYGETCAWFTEDDYSLSLGTRRGIFDLVVDRAGISVSCPDGTQWHNPDPYALTYCGADSTYESPGYWRDGYDGLMSFGLMGGSNPMLWSCGW